MSYDTEGNPKGPQWEYGHKRHFFWIPHNDGRVGTLWYDAENGVINLDIFEICDYQSHSRVQYTEEKFTEAAAQPSDLLAADTDGTHM